MLPSQPSSITNAKNSSVSCGTMGPQEKPDLSSNEDRHRWNPGLGGADLGLSSAVSDSGVGSESGGEWWKWAATRGCCGQSLAQGSPEQQEGKASDKSFMSSEWMPNNNHQPGEEAVE